MMDVELKLKGWRLYQLMHEKSCCQYFSSLLMFCSLHHKTNVPLVRSLHEHPQVLIKFTSSYILSYVIYFFLYKNYQFYKILYLYFILQLDSISHTLQSLSHSIPPRPASSMSRLPHVCLPGTSLTSYSRRPSCGGEVMRGDGET